MNLRNKMLMAFFVFIIVPLFFVGSVTYFFMQNIIERNYNDQTELAIKAVSNNVSLVLREVNSYSEYWRYKSQLTSIFAQPSSEWNDNETRIFITKVLSETFLFYTPIHEVTIYNLEGESVGAAKDQFTTVYPVDLQTLKKYPFFNEVVKLSGAPKMIGPYEMPDITALNSMYTNVRMMVDPSTMDVKGYMMQRLNLMELDNIFRFFLYNQPTGSRFMIINQDGLIMQDSGHKLGGSNLSEQLSHSIDFSKEYTSNKVIFGDVDSIVTTYKLDLERDGIKDWYVVYVTPWSAISNETLNVLKVVAAITAFCLICAIVFNLFFLNRFIRFLLGFVSSMKRVEMGDLSVRLPIKEKREMGVLARSFNSLVERISSLLEEVKLEQQHKNKAELMLLEAQIKPHFLFNTLESINGLAVQNEGKKVSQLIYRLGSMLRMFEHEEEIPLTLELDYLRNYLEIQSFRFENLFEYQIDVPASLEDYYILKLTLQPLVENSIHHGFEGYESGGLIAIRAEELEDRILIWVQDNGSGIPNEVLQRLKYKTSQITINRQIEGNERIGLGILNVADRLRIHYGARYGIWICSDLDIGTTIKIVIPKYKPQGDDNGIEGIAGRRRD